MEVDDVLGIGALDADGERVGRVEGEGDEAARRGRGRRPAEDAGVDAEAQQARVAHVEADRVLAGRLGPLHQRHPLVVVRE